jgi:hypothetical protein
MFRFRQALDFAAKWEAKLDTILQTAPANQSLAYTGGHRKSVTANPQKPGNIRRRRRHRPILATGSMKTTWF